MRGARWHRSVIAALAMATGVVFGQERPTQAPQGGGMHQRPGPGQRRPGQGPEQMMQPGQGPGQMTQPGQPGGHDRQAVPRQVIEQLRQQNPEKFQQLMKLRQTDQKAFTKELREVVLAWQKRHQMRRGGASEEELLCRELSWRYHDTEDEEEKQKLRRDLAVAVDLAFEKRVKTVETRIQHMEKELEKFRERLKQLKKNRGPVCESRVEELLRPPELNWNADW